MYPVGDVSGIVHTYVFGLGCEDSGCVCRLPNWLCVSGEINPRWPTKSQVTQDA